MTRGSVTRAARRLAAPRRRRCSLGAPAPPSSAGCCSPPHRIARRRSPLTRSPPSLTPPTAAPTRVARPLARVLLDAWLEPPPIAAGSAPARWLQCAADAAGGAAQRAKSRLAFPTTFLLDALPRRRLRRAPAAKTDSARFRFGAWLYARHTARLDGVVGVEAFEVVCAALEWRGGRRPRAPPRQAGAAHRLGRLLRRPPLPLGPRLRRRRRARRRARASRHGAAARPPARASTSRSSPPHPPPARSRAARPPSRCSSKLRPSRCSAC